MVFTHRSRMRPWHLDLTSSQNFLLFDRWSLFFFFGLMFTSSHQLTNHPLTARAPSSSENFTQSHDRSITTYCFSLFVYIQQKKTSWSSWNRSENRWRWSRACKRHCVLYDVTRCMFSPCIVLLRSGGLTGTWSRTKHFQLGRRERESPRVSCACNRAFDWAAEYSRTPRLSLVPLFLLALVSFSLILSHVVFDAATLSTANLPTLSLSLQKAFSCISLKYFALCRSCLLDIPSSLRLLRFFLFRFLTFFFLLFYIITNIVIVL